MTARVAFLFGSICGFLLAIVLFVFAVFSLLNHIAGDSAAKDFQKYHAAALHSPVAAAERDAAVARIDALRKKAPRSNLSFWAWISVSEKLDPLSADCEISAEEWPGLLEGIESAERVLGVTPPAPSPAAPEKKKK